jgi:hypothetical protein
MQTDHGEMTVGKAKGLVTGGGETEQTVGPVVNAQNAFFEKSTHGDPTGGMGFRPQAGKGKQKLATVVVLKKPAESRYWQLSGIVQ